MNKEKAAISNFLERGIDHSRSSNKGRIIFERQRGPIEDEIEGGFVTRSMIGDTRVHEEGKMIQDYNKKMKAIEKSLRKFGGYRRQQEMKQKRMAMA